MAARKGAASSSLRNRLLDRLPPKQLDRLHADLETVALEVRKTLHKRGSRLEYAYFPQSGMVSFVIPIEEGGSVEVGTVGREGMVGISLLLGGELGLQEAMVQIEGQALRMSARKLRAAIEDDAVLRLHFAPFAQCFHFQVAQTAACNAGHSLEQRLARWLLLARHRIGSDELPLTHEFLSMMLAVRRAGVTVTTGTLQQAGLIRHRRGHVTVLDPRGLEEVSCECYRLITEQEEAFLS
jgi:CRP-like cAMP-binding protein